jgi:phosphosulfolactate synthase (CoM biosynthesis protein A)
MEKLKIGDLVETCQFLPGFITSIDGDDVEVFIPGIHDFNIYFNRGGTHSIKHCGVHKIDSEYAMKLFLIGEDRLKELWNDQNSENFTWEKIVHNEYLKLIK